MSLSSTFGKHLKVTLFGESHGSHVGVVIDGFPAGMSLNYEFLEHEMERRKPGQTPFSTQRKENDMPKIISGVYKNCTTGSPITCLFENSNARSGDYDLETLVMRPSHADYTGYLRYDGHSDPRGGGHFSGRLTVGLVFAGGLAKQFLKQNGIEVIGRLSQIGKVTDVDHFLNHHDYLTQIQNSDGMTDVYFPMISMAKAIEAKEYIETARINRDSVGGQAEVLVLNYPAGVGNPIFDGIESRVSHALYGIPGVKGVLFGSGVNFASSFGSEMNDQWFMEGNKVTSTTNHNGGVNGGISNGMPIQLSVVMKPTPSIGRLQNVIARHVESSKWIEMESSINGRHDPCIVPRALPVIEAVVALVLLDYWIESVGLLNERG